MRVALHELWGCGRGPVSQLAPQVRIVVGAAAFGACMLAPIPSRAGFALLVATVVLWLAGGRVPLRIIGSTVLLGCVVLAPYLLLTPLIGNHGGVQDWTTGLRVPIGIFVHGLAGMLISVGTVTSLSASDLREGLLRLPVPPMVAAIVLQIVHQTAALGYETRRIASAMSVRGASGAGTAGFRVLASLPQVWLPRVLIRAERVGAAMELRGYCEQDLPSFGVATIGGRDLLALLLALTALALSVSLRCGLVP